MRFIGLFLLPQAILCLSRGEYAAFLAGAVCVCCVLECGLIARDICFGCKEEEDGAPDGGSSNGAPPNGTSPNSVPLSGVMMLLTRLVLIALLCTLLSLISEERFEPFLLALFVLLAVTAAASVRLPQEYELIVHILLNGAAFLPLCFLLLPEPMYTTVALVLCAAPPSVIVPLTVMTMEKKQKRAEVDIHTLSIRLKLRYYIILEIASFALALVAPELSATLLTVVSWYLLCHMGIALL